MPDLNYILLFIAIISPVILLARLRAMHCARPGGWIAASFIVLLGTGASWLLWPELAGFLGGALWTLLLLIPSLGEKKIARLVVERRYAAARRLAFVRRVLHPWQDGTELPALLRPLELASAGRLPEALDQLASARTEKTAAGRHAIAFTFALTENWSGLRDWCRSNSGLTIDPSIRTLYLRALGETGALDDLAWNFAARSQSPVPRLALSPVAAQELLFLFAFCGKTNAVVRLLRGALAGFPSPQREFWIATSEFAAGQRPAAIERLKKITGRTDDAVLQRAITNRLQRAEDFPTAHLSSSNEKLVARLVAETVSATSATPRRGIRGAPAVWALIALNLLAFAVELIFGGAENGAALEKLGALEPAIILSGHEYWRLLTALFLHYGWLHIAVNLYALYLLGPPLERMIGSLQFIAGYLITGLVSSVGVVLLYALRLTRTGQLVGASGCIMGVIGISAGLLFRDRRTLLAGRRLNDILLIVALQTVFDLVTPQVSLAAHLSGFASGVLLGLVLALFRPSRTSRQRRNACCS